VDEIDYWRIQSGLAAGQSLSAYKHHTLKTLNGGVTDSIDSLFYKLFGGELAYWRGVSGLTTGSVSDCKARFLRSGAAAQGALLRLAVSTS
jgi:hypothetical protein